MESTNNNLPIPPQGLEKPDGVMMPIIRYALIGIGSTFVSKGYLTADQLQAIVGAIMVMGTTGWLVYNKKVRGV